MFTYLISEIEYISFTLNNDALHKFSTTKYQPKIFKTIQPQPNK